MVKPRTLVRTASHPRTRYYTLRTLCISTAQTIPSNERESLSGFSRTVYQVQVSRVFQGYLVSAYNRECCYKCTQSLHDCSKHSTRVPTFHPLNGQRDIHETIVHCDSSTLMRELNWSHVINRAKKQDWRFVCNHLFDSLMLIIHYCSCSVCSCIARPLEGGRWPGIDYSSDPNDVAVSMSLML